MTRYVIAATLLFVLSTSPARADAPKANPEAAVPDGGSTLMLLGGALAATGALIAKYRR